MVAKVGYFDISVDGELEVEEISEFASNEADAGVSNDVADLFIRRLAEVVLNPLLRPGSHVLFLPCICGVPGTSSLLLVF